MISQEHRNLIDLTKITQLLCGIDKNRAWESSRLLFLLLLYWLHEDFADTLCSFFCLKKVRESAPGSLVWEEFLMVSLVQSLLCEILQISLFLEHTLKIAF